MHMMLHACMHRQQWPINFQSIHYENYGETAENSYENYDETAEHEFYLLN